MIDTGPGLDSSAATHMGYVRPRNEDRFLVHPEAGLWLVADGMGGHVDGDFASESIVEHLAAMGRPGTAAGQRARFMERLGRAHAQIRARAETRGATIGATLAALLIRGEDVSVIWSGDARVYRLRDGGIERLSTDHTEVQEMLLAGRISAAEAAAWAGRNLVTRAIGVFETPMTETRVELLQPGDAFLLCSDGLTEHVAETEMAVILDAAGAEAACQQLVALTLGRGARDNVTVVAVKCPPAPSCG